MDNNKISPSLIELAFKELKKENYNLKDKIHELPSEEEIKARENLLNLQSTALESAANGIVITDTEGYIIWVNPAFTKLTGYTKQEALTQNPRVLKSGKHSDSFYKDLWDTVSSGKVWQGDLVNKRKDGSFYNEEMTITPVKNNEGTITNFIAIKHDVTDRIKAEGKINEQNKLLSNILESIAQPFYVINASDYTIELGNSASRINNNVPKTTCYAHTHLLTTPCSSVEHPCPIEEIKRSKKPFTVEHIHYDKFKNPINVEVHGYPIFDENGEVTQIIEYSIDTTQRKLTEKQLYDSEKKLKAITNSTKDAIITVNENKEITLWNDAAQNLFGYTEKEALNNKLPDLIIPKRFIKETKERFKKITGMGKDFKGSFELVARKKDESEFIAELSVSLTQINNDWYITGIWRDLTDIKKIKKSTENEKEKIIFDLRRELSQVKSDYNILSAIIEIIPQNIYVKDLNSKFLKVNTSTIKKNGFASSEEMIGKNDADLFGKNDADSFTNEEQEIIKTGKPVLYREHKEEHKDGKITWAVSSKFPLYNKDKKVIGTFGITEDLTERKKREDELIYSQHKFRQLVNNSTLGIIRLDVDGELIMANPAMQLILGYTSELEVISLSIDKVYSSQKNYRKFLEILEKEEKINSFEGKLLKKDGTLIDVNSSAWTIKDKNNNIIYYEAIVEDITEQNQILKILHEAEFKYRMLIDKLSEAVYLLIGRKFEIVNTKFLELLEITEDDLYSDSFNMMDFISEESKKVIIDREARTKNGEEVSSTYEMGLITKNGTEKQVEISVSYLDYNGQVATQGVVRDLTEKRKTETQIRHLQKMEAIGTLAAGIAHEINTPSQFVNDNLSFLKEAQNDFESLNNFLIKIKSGEGSLDQLKQILDNIDIEYLQEELPVAINQSIDGVKRIAQIVGAMRDFSHSGPTEKVSADVHRLIENSLTISRNAWKYIANIKKEFEENLSPIVCQSSDLGQVFVNMIINASHALEERYKDSETIEGEITITTVHKNNGIEITISDNGSGMPEKVSKRIFDPFYTTKEVGKGTGQGLAIAYDIIVDKHNGSIAVESEENVGTKFIIQLPYENPE